MDNLESAAIDNSLPQEDRKEKSSKLDKIICGFTCFQIVLAIILLLFLIPDVLFAGGGFLLSAFAAIILVPFFIISVVIEVIVILIIKISNKIKANKVQGYLPVSAVYNTEISSTKQQTKRTKNLKKKLFIVLFSLVAIIIVLAIGYYFLFRYFAISKIFSQVTTALNDSSYSVTIIKNDPVNGKMTVQLEDGVTFDFACEVDPGGIDTGYGPFCDYKFSNNSSHGIDEEVFRRKYGYAQTILNKYRKSCNGCPIIRL